MPYTSEMICQRNSSNTKRGKKRRQKREKHFNSTPLRRSSKRHVHSVLKFDNFINDDNFEYKNIVVPTNVKISGWYIDRVIDYKVKSSHDGQDVYKNVFKNPKYGEKHFKIGNLRVLNVKGEIVNNLYPMADRFTDIYNIGYCVTGDASCHSHVQSNVWQNFWDTRRGKRHDKYLAYKEARMKVRAEYKKKEIDSIHKM